MPLTSSFAAPSVGIFVFRKFVRLTSRQQRSRCCTTMSAARKVTRKQLRVPLGGTNFIEIVPILSDNFSYLLGDSTTGSAIAVDPAAPDDVLSALKSANLSLSAVLTTHHHWDHSGGNKALRSKFPDLPIYGLSSDAHRIPGANKLLKDGESASLPGTALSVRALHTPCHTTGHACYVVEVPGGRKVVFTGDTLFVGGCGKFFEGNGEMMEKSLNQTLAKLSDDTLVFCGHEYTMSNLRFASSIEPRNQAISAKVAWAKEQVAKGEPTVPSTIGEEKSFNPFMRTSIPSVAEAVKCKGKPPAVVMGALRTAKNNF